MFPRVVTAANSSLNTAGSTHPIAMPAGVVAGDLLLGFCAAQAAASAAITWPGVWTELFEAAATTVPFSTAYKWAGAGEVGFDITTSVAARSATRLLRIDRAHPSTPPAIGTEVVNVGLAANPPSLNPAAWDVEDTLWITALLIASNLGVATAAPANYGGLDSHGSGATAGGAAVATAVRELRAASDDPGVWASTPSTSYRVNTVAVRPVVPTGLGAHGGDFLPFFHR
jgi:hypothetical protein